MSRTSADDSTWATRRRYFPAVEGLRGIAALLVLGGHVLTISYVSGEFAVDIGVWAGRCGVFVFFLISGFLLYRPFVAARAGGPTVGAVAPSFLLRRAVRIVPAYWVALTALAIWPGVAGDFSEHWWVGYSFLQVYSDSWLATGLPQAWSLSVELSFYLTLPLIALVLHSRGLGSGGGRSRELRWELGLLGSIAALSLAWRAYMGSDFDTVYLEHNLIGTFSWFCVGMLLAGIQVAPAPGAAPLPRLRSMLSHPLPCWSASALAFALLVSDWRTRGDFSPALVVLVDAAATAVFAAGLLGPAVFRERSAPVRLLLANRVIVFLGTVSYGIYLWHLPIAVWLAGTGPVSEAPSPAAALLALTFVSSVALGTASWYAIERPLMRKVRSVKGFTEVREGTVEIPAYLDGRPAAVGAVLEPESASRT